MMTLGNYRHPITQLCLAFSRDGNHNPWQNRLMFLAGLLTVLVIVGQLTAAGPDKNSYSYRYSTKGRKKKPQVDSKKKREREGVSITAVKGIFKEAGDRFTFYPTKEGRPTNRFYVILENLALERINRIYTEGGQERFWTVSGRLTEYRGSNYLMISKATLLRKRRK